MLKILDARLQWYMNQELPDVLTGFRKGRGTRDQTGNIHWILEKAREFQKKTSTSVSLATLKPLCGSQQTGKFLKRWKYQTTLPVSWETYMQAKKQQLEQDMKQWTGSKLGKAYIKAVYFHPAYLIYIQSPFCGMPSWMNHKVGWRLLGEMSVTSDM